MIVSDAANTANYFASFYGDSLLASSIKQFQMSDMLGLMTKFRLA